MLVVPVTPRDGAVERVEGRAGRGDDARQRPTTAIPARPPPSAAIAEADEREHVGRQAGAGHGLRRAARHAPRSASRAGWCEHARGEPCDRHRRAAMPRSARSRSWKRSSVSRPRVQMTSRPLRRVSMRPAARRRRRCQETSGWDRSTWSMQLRDRARPLREALEDAQARGVRQGLVDDGDLAQLLRRGGDGRDGRADAGGAGHGAGVPPAGWRARPDVSRTFI